MTSAELADLSGVPPASLTLYEMTGHLSAERIGLLRGALNDSGVTFTSSGVLIDYNVRGILDRAQCEKGRALLNWAQRELALESGVSTPTIVRFELGQRHPHRRTLAAIRAALEAGGVVFTNGDEPGVKLRKAEP